ncbi:hypothetical protein SOHN41_00272 [Shewanella sp. HN-41]|nr:hypothetical protein SOHN41_00272 [Shewanella sp. HN-41]
MNNKNQILGSGFFISANWQITFYRVYHSQPTQAWASLPIVHSE